MKAVSFSLSVITWILSSAAALVVFGDEPVVPAATGGKLSSVTFPPAAFAAIGSSFAQSSRLPELGWNEEQIEAFVDGVRAALHGKAYSFDETARRVSAEMGRRVHEIETRSQGSASPAPTTQVTTVQTAPVSVEQFLKEARKRLGLQQTDSGLAYRLVGGHGGLRPRPGDTVVITCVATATDGTDLPQLSSDHVRVKMTDLLPGFLEGLQMMTVDSQALLVVPPGLSFGNGEWPPGVERGVPILFQVTLHDIINAEAPAP